MSITVVYDTTFKTWNVMLSKDCIYYSHNVFELESWLIENKHLYSEVI